ncbi:DNA repair endonuclease UVH1, partial [Linum perenne]
KLKKRKHHPHPQSSSHRQSAAAIRDLDRSFYRPDRETLSRSVYVRAFTDRLPSMVAGFAKMERIMKVLYIRKLHLWPRFQVYVSEELERNPLEFQSRRRPMWDLRQFVGVAGDVEFKELGKFFD